MGRVPSPSDRSAQEIFSLLLCAVYVWGYEREKSEHCQSLRVR